MSPLGKRVRIGGYTFLVIGVMEAKGQMMGFDFDDTVYVPVASALDIFDVDELVEIDIVASNTDVIPEVVAGIRSLLMERHRGEEDFTITTQTEMLDTFGKIIGMITIAVSGIAGISLLVGAIGILTIMWISVHERTNEIGLLRALGVSGARYRDCSSSSRCCWRLPAARSASLAGLSLTALGRAAVPGSRCRHRLWRSRQPWPCAFLWGW